MLYNTYLTKLKVGQFHCLLKHSNMNIVQNKSTIYRPGIYNLQNCNISRSGKIARKS